MSSTLTAHAGNVQVSEQPTVNELLDLIAELSREIVNLDDRDNIVAQRGWETVHKFNALLSPLDRAIRVSEGGRADA